MATSALAGDGGPPMKVLSREEMAEMDPPHPPESDAPVWVTVDHTSHKPEYAQPRWWRYRSKPDMPWRLSAQRPQFPRGLEIEMSSIPAPEPAEEASTSGPERGSMR